MPSIILVEPDQLLSSLIGDFLRSAGFNIRSHPDLQRAVLAADKHKPAAIISELQLAGHSGIELLYEFRSYPDWQEVPLIIYTGLPPAQLEPHAETMSAQGISLVYKSQSGLPQLKLELERRLQPAVV